MKLRKAERQQARIRLGIQGPSGSGKTMGALLIAYGLTNNWTKIAVIDTENQSADLYAHLGRYFVLSLNAPYSPERYIEAINICQQAGIEVIIIDSLSHEWESSGGILETHGNMSGNSFANWSKLTPRHQQLVNAILSSNSHIIATIRSKQDYVLADKNGKLVPEKVGMKGVQRDGLEYELTLVFELNMKQQAVATKDRTELFMNKPEFRLCPEVGKQILEWCGRGTTVDGLKEKIQSSRDMQSLREIFNAHPEFQTLLHGDFVKKREELQSLPSSINQYL